jgi:hypothetical protein
MGKQSRNQTIRKKAKKMAGNFPAIFHFVRRTCLTNFKGSSAAATAKNSP